MSNATSLIPACRRGTLVGCLSRYPAGRVLSGRIAGGTSPFIAENIE